MDILKSISRFNKAGQGAFYTCKLIQIYNSQSFTFVYDCGTKLGGKYLEQDIETFKNNLKSKKLDLLVLSHLDDDHVNHVDILLKDISCDTVIMPYLSPLRRLLLCLSQNNLTADYISFMTDPVDYLSERNVEKIIYIVSNSDGGGIADNEFLNGNTPTPNLDGTLALDTSKLKGAKITNENKPSAINSFSEFFNSPIVTFCFDQERVFAGTFWEFYFYNKKADESDIGTFFNFIKKEYSLSDEQINDGDIWQDTLQEILINEKKVKELRKKFKKTFKCTNTTGLVVLHGPLNYKCEFNMIDRERKSTADFILPENCANKTLLNGDVNLNNIQYPFYIKRKLHEVRYFQIPHHGSYISWDGGIILNQLKGIHMPDRENKIFYPIVNYGIGNTHGHFSEQVYEDVVLKKGYKLYLNNQFQEFEYSQIFLV